MNNFLRMSGKDGYAPNLFSSMEKSARRFADGHQIRNERLKIDLWDYLLHEKVIFSSDLEDNDSNSAINLANFLKQNERPAANFSKLHLKYFCYKKSIREPNNIVVKFLIQFKKSDVFDNVIDVGEVHQNRSYKPTESPTLTEHWSGFGFARKSCVFVFVREMKYGTPRSYTLHSESVDAETGYITQMLGDSIESVENWGGISSNASRIILDSVPINMSDAEAEADCDLISRKYVQRTSPYIASYLYGEDQ